MSTANTRGAAREEMTGSDDRAARLALTKALDLHPYAGDEELGPRYKAACIRNASLEVVRECMDDEQRAALAELLRLGSRLRAPGSGAVSLDVVRLFEAAFGECATGYAWVSNAGLDLAADLLEELPTQVQA